MSHPDLMPPSKSSETYGLYKCFLTQVFGVSDQKNTFGVEGVVVQLPTQPPSTPPSREEAEDMVKKGCVMEEGSLASAVKECVWGGGEGQEAGKEGDHPLHPGICLPSNLGERRAVVNLLLEALTQSVPHAPEEVLYIHMRHARLFSQLCGEGVRDFRSLAKVCALFQMTS